MFPWDAFENIQLLGQGAYAHVYKATCTGELVVNEMGDPVKEVALKIPKGKSGDDDILKEVSTPCESAWDWGHSF